MMDNIGLDVVYGIEMVYYEDSEDPKDRPPDALKAMIDRGDMAVGALVSGSIGDPSTLAAYDAPLPEPLYKAGPLIMPQRVPVTPDDPSR
jgi:hypothetical protein